MRKRVYLNDNVRRIELLASVMLGTDKSKAEYADYFKVEEITINRDLAWLREAGIEIFGKNNKLKILSRPPSSILSNLCSEYIALKLKEDLVRQEIDPNIRKSNSTFFQNIVMLSKCVKENIIVKIMYEPLYETHAKEYVVKPYKIHNNKFNWMLFAECGEDKIIKTFLLNRIASIEVTEKKFNKKDYKTDTGDIYRIELRFIPEVKREVLEKIWFEDFEINVDDDGSTTLRTTQPITNRLAAWCISWWGAMKIIKPLELKNYIKNMYSEFKEVND